jgi:hypothetical protein
VSFFEPPPPPDPREWPEIPEPRPWWHAPRNELGVAVPLRLVLGRSERVVIALTAATAYTTGVELKLAVRRRRDPAEGPEPFYEDPMDFPFGHPALRHRQGGGELPPEILRFGVQFSDGGKATTVGSPFKSPRPGEPEEEPAGPVLTQGGGGGGGGDWDWDFWLWPLPPPGPLTLAVEWPKEGIELSKRDVDSGLFVEASKSSEILWPDDGGVHGFGRTDQLVLRAHKVDGEPSSG